ncbi:MAG: LysR family transcriptional regulator [Rhizomicrobium sp.]
MTRLTIRIDFADGTQLGPGKVRLLELVAETGSIRKAAARMKMSYRRAWLLLKALDDMFGEKLSETATGGKDGGGARLSPLGRTVVARYRRVESAAGGAAARDLKALANALASQRKGRRSAPQRGKKFERKPA